MRIIELPADRKTLASLHAGDRVALCGTVYTARDAAHKRMIERLDRGEPLPFDIENAAVYYVGPTPAPEGRPIGSAGPTTSSRMDKYTPRLMEEGLRVMIGKGRRSPEVIRSIKKHGGVYFVACGGAGALLSHCIVNAEPVAYEDLLAEAVVTLTIKEFPVFVGIDSQGNDIYELEDTPE